MKQNHIILFLCAFVHTYLHPLTFNITLAEWAQIDIQISKQPTNSTNFTYFNPIQPMSSNIFARYSLYSQTPTLIHLWQSLGSNPLDIFSTPSSRIKIPLKRGNPYSIILTEDEIRALAGDVSQIFVCIVQRTYGFIPATQTTFFYKFNTLGEDYIPLNAVVNIAADGFIAPSQFNKVPERLRSQYPEAHAIIS
jgi:hypothetical protein